ncbi:hypothetical protein CGRA01v4_11567 [Colletotrichum graminicola]|nr:hypothetical protein CGRA01v4_11567 [Colletotrichum graminicola]
MVRLCLLSLCFFSSSAPCRTPLMLLFFFAPSHSIFPSLAGTLDVHQDGMYVLVLHLSVPLATLMPSCLVDGYLSACTSNCF